MKKEVENDQDVRELFQRAFANEEPSEALKRKLNVKVYQARRPARRWFRSGIAVVCSAAAVIAVVALTLTPTQATAKTYANLLAAADKVNAYQFSISSTEDGKKEFFTMAGQNGTFSMRTDDGMIMKFDSGSLQIYDKEDNEITKIKLGKAEDVQRIAEKVQSGVAKAFKEMDLKKTLREYEAKYGKGHVMISTVAREGDRDVYNVTLASPDEPDRVLMKVDAQTDLPRRMVVETKVDGEWHQDTAIDMRFGNDVDASVLPAEFPKDAKVNEIDLGGIIGEAFKSIGSAGGGK